MPDLGLLDSLIALVVVLLVLSLIVQSLQSALKKLLKIKSRQIEDSLLDLFENALDAPSPQTRGMLASSPVLRLLAFPVRRLKSSKDGTQPANLTSAQELFTAVKEKFGEVGRVAQSGRMALDSVSKEDLLKVMARVAPGKLLPDVLHKLEDACRQVLALDRALAAVGSTGLSGESAARLAALRQAVAPMVNDVRAVFDGQKLEPNLLIGDVVRLREVRLDELLAALAELQKGIDREIAKAARAGQDTGVLQAASQALTRIADELAALAAKFDAAVAPLRARLRSVETWFDTVMQSFEERYSRGMRTWTFVLSLAVVIAADANFFTVFDAVLHDKVLTSRLAQVAQEMASPAAGQPAPGVGSPTPTPPPAAVPPAAAAPAPAPASPAAAVLPAHNRSRILLAGLPPAAAAPDPAGATEPDAGSLTPTPAPTPAPAASPAGPRQDLEEAKRQLERYETMGFQPLTRAALRDDFKNAGRGANTLGGWLAMALLLSVGAPFWQDTLESLFGVKNLLRKRGQIQNVEQRSGEGNPKQA